MNEQIVETVNKDLTSDWYIPKEGTIKFINNKLYQYQWSGTDKQFAWYLVEKESG